MQTSDPDQPIDALRPGAVYDYIPKLGQLRDDVVFGQVWEDESLSKRDRSLITVAILTALYRSDELEIHVRRAVENGVSEQELKDLVVHAAFYAGWPCALNTGRIMREAFEPTDA